MATSITNGEGGKSVRDKINGIWDGLVLNEKSAAIPAGAVAICEVNPWATPGDHLAWMQDASKSWYQETAITTTYLGAVANETAARAVAGAAYLDWYWNTTDKKCYQLNAGTGQTEKFRFGKQAFVARFAVSYSDRVILLDEAGVPWMVFKGLNAGSSYTWFGSEYPGVAATSVEWAGSTLLIGCAGAVSDVQGLSTVDFAKERFSKYSYNNRGYVDRPVADRNSSFGVDHHNSFQIVQSSVNAVAATVLPNAPADPDTGLPVPTIVVGTDGGISVIDGPAGVGTVVDITNSGDTGYQKVSSVAFIGSTEVVFGMDAHTGERAVRVHDIPSADDDIGALWYNKGSSKRIYKGYSIGLEPDLYFLGDSGSSEKCVLGGFIASNLGLTRIFENPADPASGMVAYQGPDFATPPMFGDVKGAFLCEQGQAGTLVGANVENSTFTGTGVLDGWTLGATAINNNGVNQLDVTSGAASNVIATKTITGLTIGQWVKVQMPRVDTTKNSAIFAGTLSSGYAATGVATLDFQATDATQQLQIRSGGASENIIVTGVTVDVATPDRSVNGKGLIINGSLNRDADGYVGGYSAINYIEQPYNPDLDFAGDFFAFVDIDVEGDGYLFCRGEKGVSNTMYLRRLGGVLKASVNGAIDATVDLPSGTSGVVGLVLRDNTLEIWQYGRLVGSGSATPDITGVGYVLRTGIKTSNTTNALVTGSLRGFVIGAGAPSPAQIRTIANWKGGVIEGTIQDLHYAEETKSLWVLTTSYLYEVGPDGAERSKEVNDISATTLAAWNGGRLVS